MLEGDVLELLSGQVPEGLRLDYKRDLYGNSDSEKRELLKDVSSFANTSGGHLIVGIDEANGLPVKLVGVSSVNPDDVILRLDQSIRSGIEPRIQGVRVKAVSLAAGGHCFVIRVPRSWQPPHRVSAQGSNRYWIRNSGGSHEASVDELRTLFTRGADALERARLFRDERVRTIQSARGIRPLIGNGRAILHIVPLASIAAQFQVDLSEAAKRDQMFQPINAMGFSPRYNFDGFIVERAGEVNNGYTQIFRNGIIEATRGAIVRPHEGRSMISSINVERHLFEVIPLYLEGLRQLGVPPPIAVMLTLEGVEGAVYKIRDNPFDDPEPVIDRNVLALPDVLIEEYGQPVDYDRAMRPTIDALWNAAGAAVAESFGPDGRWRGQRT